jgi:hypothetical protein
MELTRAQKNEIYKKGFVVLRDLIPHKKINVCLRAINYSIGQGMNKEDIKEFRSLSFCPELRGKPPVLDLLYETPIWSAVQSLIGKNKVRLWGSGQIALRFPVMEAPGKMYPHIDGMYNPGNRVQKGTLETFTMLAGVLLSDVPNQYWGNFTAWPGSHHFLEDYFRKHGVDAISNELPPLKASDAHQIIGKAGDVILCHYQLAHTVAINVSPYVRYAVFFRLKHTEHAEHRPKVLTDIWMEWPGIREIL